MSQSEKKIPWSTIHFVKSCQTKEHYPKLMASSGKPLVEIACVGRSNVGKSSLLNDLFGVKNLAKTSQTPGKTQLINFFQIDDLFAVVDLPGYGYAKVPQAMKKTWGKNIQEYLEKSTHLSLILLLLDIRHMPTADDLAFFEWAEFHNKKTLIIFTKVDKVNQHEKTQNAKKILSILSNNDIESVYYSIKTGEGQKELRYILTQAVNGTY